MENLLSAVPTDIVIPFTDADRNERPFKESDGAYHVEAPSRRLAFLHLPSTFLFAPYLICDTRFM